MSFGFGAPTSAAAQPSGGFGGFRPAATATAATPAPSLGFGGFAAKPFGGGFGAGSTTSSSLFGGGGGGFASNTTAAALKPPPPPPPPPYTGVKGPGYHTDWSRNVNFATVSETTTFEALPPALQQHLIELRTFMQTERAASKSVWAYLNEAEASGHRSSSNEDSSNSGSGGRDAARDSYRALCDRLGLLQGSGSGGEGSSHDSSSSSGSARDGEVTMAVDLLAVDGAQQERDVRATLQRLEDVYADVQHYQQAVWLPLMQQSMFASPSALSSSSSSSQLRWQQQQQQRARRYGGDDEAVSAQRFFRLTESLSHTLTRLQAQVDEFVQTLRASVGDDAAPDSCSNGSNTDAAALARRGVVASPALDDVALVNASLTHELQTLTRLSAVAATQHRRSDVARDLFARQYGRAEAEALFACTRDGHNNDSGSGDMAGDEHDANDAAARLRRACDELQLYAASPTTLRTDAQTTTAPAATAPTATTTTTAGGFGFAAPASTTPAPAAATTTTAGGFGFAAPASTTPAPAATTTTTAGGFGFAAPATAAPAPAAAATTGAVFGSVARNANDDDADSRARKLGRRN